MDECRHCGGEDPLGKTQLHWVEDADGCWLAIGKPDRGYIVLPKPTGNAHRWAYVQANGPIPPGGVIDHECHNEAVRLGLCKPGVCKHRRCVNPAHLRAVRQGENTVASAPFCKRGHAMLGDNVKIRASDGRRRCHQCHLDGCKRRRQRSSA